MYLFRYLKFWAHHQSKPCGAERPDMLCPLGRTVVDRTCCSWCLAFASSVVFHYLALCCICPPTPPGLTSRVAWELWPTKPPGPFILRILGYARCVSTRNDQKDETPFSSHTVNPVVWCRRVAAWWLGIRNAVAYQDPRISNGIQLSPGATPSTSQLVI